MNTSDAPVGSTEAELKRLGARVTRLLAPVLVPRRNLDGPTFRMLGHLYAGLVIPDNACRTSHEVSVVAGVPVVYESQGATGLIASVDVTGD